MWCGGDASLKFEIFYFIYFSHFSVKGIIPLRTIYAHLSLWYLVNFITRKYNKNEIEPKSLFGTYETDIGFHKATFK